MQGAWESFLDLYGAEAMPPKSANAELMVAASLHQWHRIEKILQRLVAEQEGRSPRRNARTDRADTPVPEAPDASMSSAAIEMPHHTMHVSPAVQAVSSMQTWPGICKDSAADPTCPPLKRRRAGSAVPIPAMDSAGDGGAGSPAVPQTDAVDHVPAYECKFTWLIAQLMGAREPEAQRSGQPAVSTRDRILALLRPMMNFQEKVTYFQDEQDRLLEYELDQMGDDETLHIEVHRGPDMLVEMVEQISKVDDEMLRRELTVSFVGEDGEDGGGLLREFCAVRQFQCPAYHIFHGLWQLCYCCVIACRNLPQLYEILHRHCSRRSQRNPDCTSPARKHMCNQIRWMLSSCTVLWVLSSPKQWLQGPAFLFVSRSMSLALQPAEAGM